MAGILGVLWKKRLNSSGYYTFSSFYSKEIVLSYFLNVELTINVSYYKGEVWSKEI